MSFLRGKDGLVKVNPETIIQVTDWTLTIDGTGIDLSVLGDEWKQQIQGSRGWSATINGYLAMEDTNGQRALINEVFSSGTDGTIAQVDFVVDLDGVAEDYFYGSAVITQVAINNPGNDDVVRVSMNLQGTGLMGFVDTVE